MKVMRHIDISGLWQLVFISIENNAGLTAIFVTGLDSDILFYNYLKSLKPQVREPFELTKPTISKYG